MSTESLSTAVVGYGVQTNVSEINVSSHEQTAPQTIEMGFKISSNRRAITCKLVSKLPSRRLNASSYFIKIFELKQHFSLLFMES